MQNDAQHNFPQIQHTKNSNKKHFNFPQKICPKSIAIFSIVCIILIFLFLRSFNQSEVTATFVCNGDQASLELLLSSFAAVNTFKLKQIYVIIDEKISQKIKPVQNKYPNFIWIETEQKLGQIESMDLAIQYSTTPYVFYCQDSLEFIKGRFIQESLQQFRINSKIWQVLLEEIKGVQKGKKVELLDDMRTGFKMGCGLIRKNSLNGQSLQNISFDISRGYKAGLAQSLISYHFHSKGFQITTAKQVYVKPILHSTTLTTFQYDKKFLSKPVSKMSNQELSLCKAVQIDAQLDRKRFGAMVNLLRGMQIKKQSFYSIEKEGKEMKGFEVGQIGYDKMQKLNVWEQYLNFDKVFYYDVLQNLHALKQETPKPKLQIAKVNNQSYKKYISSQSSTTTFELSLATLLSSSNPSQQSLQSQYLHYTAKYGCFRQQIQMPICIILDGFDLGYNEQYKDALESIERQNYSNYRVVIVDDGGQDDGTMKIRNYVNMKLQKVGNRAREFVRNVDQIGHNGNLHIAGKTFCKQNQIVVPLCPNCKLIGNQALSLINSVYHNQSTWVVTFPILSVTEIATQQNPQVLVTFLNFLNFKIPIDHLSSYIYDQQLNIFKPSFNSEPIYQITLPSLKQLAGLKIKNLDDYLIYQNERHSQKGQTCREETRKVSEKRVKVKIPVKELKSKDAQIERNYGFVIKMSDIEEFRHAQEELTKCLDGPGQFKQNNQIPMTSFQSTINQTLSAIQYPNQYIDIHVAQPFPLLPFCIFLQPTALQSKIHSSIQSQNYSPTLLKIISLTTSPTYSSIIQSLYQCHTNSILIFPNGPLPLLTLKNLSNIYQMYNIWSTYSYSDHQFIHVQSVYMRVFQLLANNDFQGSIHVSLQAGVQEIWALGILQLTPNNTYLFNSIPSGCGNSNQWLCISMLSPQTPKILPSYQYLTKLSQDYLQDVKSYEQKLGLFMISTQSKYRAIPKSYLTKLKYIKASQYEQLPYLPADHSLNIRQKIEVEKQFVKGNTQQISLCVTIVGRNNTQNNRINKTLYSILQQNYTNYHIVYVDDASTDNSLPIAQSILANKINSNQAVLVSNKIRKYATYNLLNAAYRYCKPEDIQVRMDADDQLIGKQVFNIISAHYIHNPNDWVFITNLKTSLFTYGTGWQLSPQDSHQCLNKAIQRHFFSAVSTWRIGLIKQVPLQFQVREDQQFLDTLYDDALQTGFYWLAGVQRIGYAPHIGYHYNKNYGSNDDSNRFKIYYRRSIFQYLIALEGPKKLESLQGLKQNEKIKGILQRDHQLGHFELYKQPIQGKTLH